jgi:hypothetical protein
MIMGMPEWARRWRAAREGLRRAAEEDRRLEMEALTGWWVTGMGDVVLVRFDPVISRFVVDGRVWPDREVLRAYLMFCEKHDGWSPLMDAATVRVRERLRLPEVPA